MTSYPEQAPRHQLVPAAYVVFSRSGESGGREILLQRRSGTGYMDGYWALVAGHVEPGESCLAAAIREALEEVGLTVRADALQPLCTLHRTDGSDRPIEQRADFFFLAEQWTGEPTRREPDKSSALDWFALSALPDPVVPHELLVLRHLATGTVPAVLTYGFG
ncbi:MAG TPA: NUDIX domain-containing protein [Nocardioidaceae bacterium]|nr:NUDIX domain-containing protein [Nocardioidaceae bacterium]